MHMTSKFEILKPLNMAICWNRELNLTQGHKLFTHFCTMFKNLDESFRCVVLKELENLNIRKLYFMHFPGTIGRRGDASCVVYSVS